jgi:hypothetical protein
MASFGNGVVSLDSIGGIWKGAGSSQVKDGLT